MDTIAYCEVTQCDKHPKETVKMACKTCYLFACVICNGPGKCKIKHMTKNHLICETVVIPLKGTSARVGTDMRSVLVG